ncbi:hypothetical protein IFM89_021634 [Coptis chinensis]|uniref:PHL domain-containing protein n=1 Tax=Coptis chinensis TaxID=261450 RepID=A0A835IEF7_9MAGN|nr:hypothetical protein IFM89_021634 [Coptis chinensis]
MAMKRRSNSVPRTPAMSGVGSPCSVGNMMVPMNASSPSISTQPLADQMILERFSKIETVTQRPFSLDSNPNSTGNVSIVPKARNRLVMSEKQNDGTVAMQYGDIDDNDFQLVEDHMPTLPNTYYADLLGAQFISLMIREGYQHTDDQVRPKPTASLASNTQSNASAVPSSGMTAEMQQYPETNTGQASSAITTSVSSGNASLNTPQSHQTNSWMLPPGSSQALQMSQGFMPGTARPVTPQQLDSQTPLMQQQLQNQHPQIQQHAQRPSLMSSASPLSHLNAVGQNSNVQLGNHMVSKSSHSHSQLQLLQQQQQQQQQQRKMMMGLGPAMNMGNLGNNVVGLGGLGNVLGMGGIRPGISPSMGPISGIGNMGQNPMNPSSINNVINQQLLSGNITHAQATFMASKFKSAQNRANMSRATQSGITGLTGTGQMHPGSAGFSMLGQTLNRSNINPLQRTNLAAMGPPKMIPGTNFFMNQQQQQLQQQHQQQQLQQQQQHMQQQQQQQISSPLQAVVSSPQVGSPSAMAIPQQITQLQQQISPQQINQQTPMSPRLSSGTLPPLNTTNAGTGPPSPQLSSQTLGSVGSITSSSMELQGVNKSNSMNNV